MNGERPLSARSMRRLPWSAPMIGITLGTQRSVAVERVDDDLRWVLDGPGIPTPGDAAEAVGALLERLPLEGGRWRRATIAVALASDFAQQKHIFGLPPVRDRATANALVREGAPRFFRRTSEEIVTSDLEFDEGGSPMGAAFHGEIIRAIRAACASRGLRLVAIVPATSLPTDGQIPSSMVDPEMILAWRACGLVKSAAAVRFNALTGGVDGHHLTPERLRLAALVASASVALALMAPLASARLLERSARLAHDQISEREVSALATSYELGRVSAALAAVSDRSAERRSVLELLAHLAALLPPGSVLTHLQVDSTGGTLVALAPSADGVLRGISESTLIATPEIVGPVTRELTGTREVERVTLRFAHRSDALPRERP